MSSSRIGPTFWSTARGCCSVRPSLRTSNKKYRLVERQSLLTRREARRVLGSRRGPD
jgi:hypothetical protein